MRFKIQLIACQFENKCIHQFANSKSKSESDAPRSPSGEMPSDGEVRRTTGHQTCSGWNPLDELQNLESRSAIGTRVLKGERRREARLIPSEAGKIESTRSLLQCPIILSRYSSSTLAGFGQLQPTPDDKSPSHGLLAYRQTPKTFFLWKKRSLLIFYFQDEKIVFCWSH